MNKIFGWALIAAMSFSAVGNVVQAEQVDVWFGTTTPKNGLSKGIYHAQFDADKGKLTTPKLAAEITSPGFLALHPSLDVLYSTGKLDGVDGVHAYSIGGQKAKRTLTLIGSVATGDGGAAHVSVDQSGNVLLSAQYGSGTTCLFELDDAGAITRRVQSVKHAELLADAGSHVVPRRQDSPHAHWTGTSPDNRFAFVPDLGMDKVVIYRLDCDKPSIEHVGFGECVPGGGPRHMKFSVDGKRIFVLNELELSVTVFDYDSDNGTMTAGQTIPSLSSEVKANETFNSASEIRVHDSGKFVYSANRGHDSITAYAIDENGKLSVVDVEPIRGGWPRNFNIDPTGKWIVAAGRDSHTATVFSIDENSGELTFVRETAVVPSPICVVFAN